MVASTIGAVVTVLGIVGFVGGELILRKHERDSLFVDDWVEIGLTYVKLFAIAAIGTGVLIFVIGTLLD